MVTPEGVLTVEGDALNFTRRVNTCGQMLLNRRIRSKTGYDERGEKGQKCEQMI